MRCEVCNKVVTPDELQVVKDLTAVVLAPAFSLSADVHEADLTLDGLVGDLLDDNPICTKCWHRTNNEYPLGEGAMRVVEAAMARSALPPNALFIWTRVK